MATEQTEPRVGLITGLAVVTIVTLVLTRTFLQSYYHVMYDEEYVARVGGNPSPILAEIRAQQRGQLGSIESAMRTIASGTRPAALEPRPSADADPIKGWGKMPRPYEPPPPPPPPPAPPAVEVGDGGVVPAVVSGDGGVATPAAAGDASAPMAAADAAAGPVEGPASGTGTSTHLGVGITAPAPAH